MSSENNTSELYVAPLKEDGSIDYEKIPDWCMNDSFYRKEFTSETTDGYCDSAYGEFNVRSASYLTDRVKIPAIQPMFRTLGINVICPDKKVYHSAEIVDSLREYMEKYAHIYSEYFITNWQLPGPPYYNVIHLYGRIIPEGEDPTFDLTYTRFKNGDDQYRSTRLKFFPCVVTGPWAVRLAANQLGGNKPCIIGNKLTNTYNIGKNYVEVNIDVGSSKIASTLNSLIVRSAKSLCVDEGFLIEGQEVDELPERFIAISRFIHCTVENVKVEIVTPEGYEPLDKKQK